MFEVALSRRMCCSRVCSARRYAGVPSASLDTPTRRPGILRCRESTQAMKPACGPPKNSGTPKRWAEPTAMSAPREPGEVTSTWASRSAATVTSAPASFAAEIRPLRSRIRPVDPGLETTTPTSGVSPAAAAKSAAVASLKSTTLTGMSAASARASVTVMDCWWREESSSTTPPCLAALVLPRAMSCTASATAVASSSRDAPAIGRPVRSCTMVWKFSRASRRPWEISGWYGV